MIKGFFVVVVVSASLFTFLKLAHFLSIITGGPCFRNLPLSGSLPEPLVSFQPPVQGNVQCEVAQVPHLSHLWMQTPGVSASLRWRQSWHSIQLSSYTSVLTTLPAWQFLAWNVQCPPPLKLWFNIAWLKSQGSTCSDLYPLWYHEDIALGFAEGIFCGGVNKAMLNKYNLCIAL